MVVFTCNHCGESLKKQIVDKHAFRCRQQISVSCMDCFKDFDRESYNGHLQCITELQRYSGKDYVPKANANKGQKKQEAWVSLKSKFSLKSCVIHAFTFRLTSFVLLRRRKQTFQTELGRSSRQSLHMTTFRERKQSS